MKHTSKFLIHVFCISNTSWKEVSSRRLDLDFSYSQRKLASVKKTMLFTLTVDVILFHYFCFMFSILFLRVLYFAGYVDISLDSKWERTFFRKKTNKQTKKRPKIFQYKYRRMDLSLSTNILLFDVLTILMQHVVLFFSILLSQDYQNLRQKGKH